MAELDIRPARREDFEAARSLLLAARLPVDDLCEERMADFRVATSGNSIVGLAGLEPFAEVGLLRSLVVEPRFRATGVGRLLVAAMEAYASRRGISEVWLLTIDADRYFQALGYVAVERDAAPPAIRQTAEFSLLCPGSATLMRKAI